MQQIVTVNAGSSSVKLGIFSFANDSTSPERVVDASLSGLGQPEALLRVNSPGATETSKHVSGADQSAVIALLMGWLVDQTRDAALTGVGHRVVHGGPHNAGPRLVTDELEHELEGLGSYDPEHAPLALRLLNEMRRQFPNIPQAACFDTAFFHDMPPVAQLLPLPRRYEDKGLRRYGFHGLSYSYLLAALREAYGPEVASGKVIMAHLGSGASLAAVQNGQPVDTTMSFTPASGIPMSTRSGDLDPGIAWYLQNQAGLDVEAFNRMVNFEAGLLGVSGLSGDMYTLLQHEASNAHAKEAVELFCYQVKKAIGGLAAALNGLDTLVFSGGIGEQSALLRSRICDELGFLGITIDHDKNSDQRPEISGHDSKVTVLVIPTDENRIIAQETWRIIAQSNFEGVSDGSE